MKQPGRCSLLLSIIVAACSSDGPSGAPQATVADSAGVRIGEYPAVSREEAGLALHEVLRVGMLEGPQAFTFGAIADGLILGDGSIVVADRETSQIRRFSSKGEFLGSQGRSGQGPGEFEYIRELARCRPDGFTVFNIDYRMSHYDERGTFLETYPVRWEGAASPYHLACDTDGTIAGMSWGISTAPQIGFYTSMASLRIMNPDGSERANLGERIGSERFGTPRGSGPHPVGRSTVFGFQRGDLIVADGSFFGYERWRDGQMTEIVRIDVPPADADSLMAEYLEVALSRTTSDDQRRAWRQEIEGMQGPDRASHLSAIFVTEDRVLIQELSASGAGRWFEFRADGQPVGWWTLPAGSTLLDVLDDQVLVSDRDELGVEQAVLYRIGPAALGA